MAYKPEQWEKAKALFELGMSLQDIADEIGFKDKTAISKKAKAQGWEKAKNQHLKAQIKAIDREKSTLDAKINTTVEKVAKLSDFEITILNEQVQDETGRKSLLFSTANLSLIRKNQLLTKNTKTVITKEEFYEDGKKVMTKEVEKEIELSPNDLKALDEGIEVNAKSLELAPRHANQNLTLNTQNNQIMEERKWTVEVVKP